MVSDADEGQTDVSDRLVLAAPPEVMRRSDRASRKPEVSVFMAARDADGGRGWSWPAAMHSV